MAFIVAQKPQFVALSHHETRDFVKPLVLLFLTFFLVLWVANGERIHLVDMSLEPLLAPISPEDLHPADPVLTLGNVSKGAGTRDNPTIQETTDGLNEESLHG
jgi:hypothetical protein